MFPWINGVVGVQCGLYQSLSCMQPDLIDGGAFVLSLYKRVGGGTPCTHACLLFIVSSLLFLL
jgi:hypothetical protein